MDIRKTVQTALLGEVPPSLRFIYAYINGEILYFHAVFDNTATEEHLECGRRVSTELAASLGDDYVLNEKIEVNPNLPWKINDGDNLLFLRYGEMSEL